MQICFQSEKRLFSLSVFCSACFTSGLPVSLRKLLGWYNLSYTITNKTIL